MRKDLLNRKEPALDDSEHFEPIQVVKYAQTRRLAFRRCALERKLRVWLDNLWLLLERLGIGSWIHSTISIEARNGDGVLWQRSLRTLLSQY